MSSDPPSYPSPRVPKDGGARPMSLLALVGWGFGFIFLFVASALLVPAMLPHSVDGDLVVLFGCQAVAFIVGLFLLLRTHAPDEPIRKVIGLRATHPLFYALGPLLGGAAQYPVGWLYEVIEKRWPLSAEAKVDTVAELFFSSSTLQRAVTGLVIVVAGPALEEIVFRGALFGPARRTSSVANVISVTALLFAASHLNPHYLIPMTLFGLSAGLLRASSGSLIPSVLMHMTFNGITFAFMALRVKDDSPPVVTVVSAVILVALLGATWLLGRRSEKAALAQALDRA